MRCVSRFFKNIRRVCCVPPGVSPQSPRTIVSSAALKMAWRSTGSSNAELIDNLATNGMLPEDPRARAAFLAVDRKDYTPWRPYEDAPQSIGHGATISAPHMHAMAIKYLWEYVVPQAGGRPARVLDVGAGSGYLTHVLGMLEDGRTGSEGFSQPGLVLGIEHIPALRDIAEANMRKSENGRALLDSGRVVLVAGDGRRGALSVLDQLKAAGIHVDVNDNETKFDAIHVGAAAREAHEPLLEQLRAPGRIFIPLEDSETGEQHMWTIDKNADGKVTRTKLFGVRYVPLTDAPGPGSTSR